MKRELFISTLLVLCALNYISWIYFWCYFVIYFIAIVIVRSFAKFIAIESIKSIKEKSKAKSFSNNQ